MPTSNKHLPCCKKKKASVAQLYIEMYIMYVYALYFVSFYMVVYGLFGIFWSMSTLLNETILTYIKKSGKNCFRR